MVQPDESQGQTKAEVRSQQGQQILAAYQAYKQSGGQPAPKTPSPPPTPLGKPTTTPAGSNQVTISQANLNKSNYLRAQQDLPPLQEVSNVRVVQPTRSNYAPPAGPQPEKIVTPPQKEPVLNATPQQQQIAKTQQTINQISSDFTAAKNAGVTSIQVKDSNGNVIGTVNPQNVSQARLQYLNLTKKGAVSYEFSTTTKENQSSTTASLTTYQPKNTLTAFTGGALGGFAELGLIGLGLVAKATGKSITIPGTNYTAKPSGVFNQASEKVQKTFGQDTLDKIVSGQKVDFTNPLEIASLSGLGVSIVATGGTGGIKAAITAPSRLIQALRSPIIAKTVAVKSEQYLVKIPNAKSSTGVLSDVVGTSSVTGVSKAGKTVTTSNLSNVGMNTKTGINTYADLNNYLRQTGVIGKVEETGKATTGVFSGEGKGKIITSTPDKTGKLSYISSGVSASKGGSGGSNGGGSRTVISSQGLIREEKLSTQKFTREPNQILQRVTTEKLSSTSSLKPQLAKLGTKQILYSGTKTKVKSSNQQVQATRQETKQTAILKFANPKEKIKQKNTNALIVKTKSKQTTATVQKQVNITKQITAQTTISHESPLTKGETKIPDNNKRRFGGLPLGINPLSGALGKVGKGGNRQGYIGNVPLTSIVGVYKRGEITYGNVKAEKQSKAKTPKLNKRNTPKLL